jgi:phosphatidylinositol alpha-1,6-mannosyltransferase
MIKPVALVVTRNLPPLVGGMERLLWQVACLLRRDYRVIVIGPLGCKDELPKDVTVIEVRLKPTALFFLRSLFVALLQSLNQKPAIILAGSGLTAPIVWIAARTTHTSSMVYLHGLDIVVRHYLYRLIWLPAIRRMDSVFVNSNHTMQLAIKAGIKSSKINVLHPGVEMPELSNAEERSQSFRSRYDLSDSHVMLHVGRIVGRKGIFNFINNIMPSIISALPNSNLVIVGAEAKDALIHSNDESRDIDELIAKSSIDSNIYFLGRCSDKELGDAYLGADVLVFPLQYCSTDIEGFGMVAIEAAAHGLPVVAFAVGGVIDAVRDNECGSLVPAGDDRAFADSVIYQLQSSKTAITIRRCREFAREFEWHIFGEKLLKICNKYQNEK